MEVTVVAGREGVGSGRDSAPVPGHEVDLATLPPAVADRLSTFLEGVDAIAELGSMGGTGLDGTQAVAIATVLARPSSRDRPRAR
jgi:hypothetical protein